jgi:hypothetical protein
MTNLPANVESLRRELATLAGLQAMDVGPATRRAIHDRMQLLAFQLQAAVN